MGKAEGFLGDLDLANIKNEEIKKNEERYNMILLDLTFRLGTKIVFFLPNVNTDIFFKCYHISTY